MTNHGLVVALGLLAGVLTTLAGQGGGLLALLVLSQREGPHVALAITAPGLLVANAHRTWLYRASVDRVCLRAIGPAGLFASLAGAVWTVRIPEGALRTLLVCATGFALARGLGWVRIAVSRAALGPAGAVIGALSATSGGAGALLGPLLVSAGLAREALVATSAALSVTLHGGRLGGYLASGALRAEHASPVAFFTAGLLAGNLVGRTLRGAIPPRAQRALELGTMVVAAAWAALHARG